MSRIRLAMSGLLTVLGLLLIGSPTQAAESAPGPQPFDHLTTGFELLGQHRDLPCEACHVNAVFKGTPRECAACHGVGTAVRATAKPVNHILSSDRCDACHDVVAWTPAVNFDHTELQGSCSTCHNNVQAQGKPPTHIDTDLECNVCHSTVGWAGASFSHQGITDGCASCHDGVHAPGMPSNHIPTSGASCESCHSASNFTTFAMPDTDASMNHGVVAATACSTCHEAGRSFAGSPPIVARPPAPHVTSGECSNCHFSTVSFAGAQNVPANHIPLPAGDGGNCAFCHANPADYSVYAMSHANIASNCAQCHAAGLSFANIAPPTLVELPGNHIPIGSAACESCHSASNFASFSMPDTDASMNHSVVSSMACSTCHEAGKNFVGSPPIVTRPPAPHVTSGECSTCHFSTASFAGAVNMPSNHIPLPAGDNNTCTLCHSNSNDYSVYAMNHLNIASNCAQCHAAGLSFANIAPPTLVEQPNNHIPIGQATCESCHSASNFASFSMPDTDASMNHSVVSSMACSSCHEAGKSFVGSPPIVTRPPAPHVASGECSNCHFSTASFAGASNYPSNHIPVPAADNNNCSLCHTNSSDYSIYAMNHVNITSNCAQCHGPGLGFANMAPPTLKEPPTGNPAHIPVPGNIACELCHSATNVTTFAGTVMRHAAVPGQACDSCHEYKMAWYGEPKLWTRPSPSHHTGHDCGGSGCHTSRDKTALRPLAAAATARARRTLARVGSGGVAALSAATPPSISTGRTALGQPAPFNHLHAGNAPCASCHNGITATAKPAGHIPTTNDCGSCHTTLSWTRVAIVDHLQVMGSCASCHNGQLAVGKPLTHVSTRADCGSCHTSNAWVPARFDHAASAVVNCRSCHDSVHATGLPADHVQTAQDCSACHGTLAWQPARVDHGTLTVRCASCHNNVVATGLPATHIATSADCASCHSYPAWEAVARRAVPRRPSLPGPRGPRALPH